MSELLLANQPLPKRAQDTLAKYDIAVVTKEAIQPEQLGQVTMMYVWDDQLGQQILAQENQLKWVQNIGAGVNNLPQKQLDKAGVQVTNASGVKSRPIAQTVLAYILFVARGLHHYVAQQTWSEFTDQYLLSELPVLIFGTGSIGAQLAEYIQTLGGTAYGVNTRGQAVAGFDKVVALSDVAELLPKVKVIVDTLPATEATQHYFNTAIFDQVDDLILFANVGRGDTVDQTALLQALDAQKIRFAALDVTTPEPLPDGHELLMHPKILVTQHTSWAEHQQPKRPDALWDIFEQNLPSYLAGEKLPVNRVDLTRGY